MKWIYLVILILNCLQARKSAFDSSKPSGLFLGAISQNLSTGTNTSTSTTTSLQISSTSPTNNATGIAANSALSATFNNGLDTTTVTTTNLTLAQGSTSIAGAVSYSSSNKTVTFQPSSNLSSYTQYTFTISKNIKDTSGNILGNDNIITFTTADTTAPTVTVTNLKSKGTIETGLIFGTASDNISVSKVEVQINSGSYQTATGTTSWSYKYPAKQSWLSGNSNSLNIRVTDSNNNQTVSQLTNLLKLANQDFNNDGFVDLVVTTPTYNTNFGRIYIFNGSSSGMNYTLASSANKTITGASGDKLGTAFTVGDFNGDVYPDLGACAKRGASLLNQVYVYNGSASGLSTSASWTINDNTTNNELCTAIAAGDFNGDGYDDLAITDLSGSGVIKIFNGGTSGINGATPYKVITGSGNMGAALATGDINGDGYIDTIVSQFTSALIYIYYGSSTSLSSSASYSISVPVGVVNYTDVLMMNDVTGDGKLDLIYGAQTYSSSTGRIYIQSGNGSTFNSTPNYTITGGGGCCAGLSSFGNSMFIADVNEDGILDILAGAYKYNNGGSNNGKIYVFYGGSSLATGTADSVNNGYINGETTNPNWSSQFGSFMAARDTNADGIKDLIVGASAFTSVKGAAYIFSNISSAFSSTAATSNYKIIVGELANDAFGTFGF